MIRVTDLLAVGLVMAWLGSILISFRLISPVVAFALFLGGMALSGKAVDVVTEAVGL